MSPGVSNNSNVRVINTWRVTRIIDSAIMIFILINFNSNIYNLIIDVNANTHRYFHNSWVVTLDEVLCQVVLAADAIRLKVSTYDTNMVSIDTQVVLSHLAVNIDVTN
jgi:membrane protein YdbS with pleckstrin-like domain